MQILLTVPRKSPPLRRHTSPSRVQRVQTAALPTAAHSSGNGLRPGPQQQPERQRSVRPCGPAARRPQPPGAVGCPSLRVGRCCSCNLMCYLPAAVPGRRRFCRHNKAVCFNCRGWGHTLAQCRKQARAWSPCITLLCTKPGDKIRKLSLFLFIIINCCVQFRPATPGTSEAPAA